MNEEEKLGSFMKWMMQTNPGIACSMKIRKFIESWIEYKIDMLPMVNGMKDKMEQEFSDLITKNFENKNENQD